MVTGTGVNVTGTLNSSGNANLANLGVAGTATVTGNANVGNIGAATGIFTANVSVGSYVLSPGGSALVFLPGTGITRNYGNLDPYTGGYYLGGGTRWTGIRANSADFATTLNVTGNANVGNLGTAGLITATGNIQGGNLVSGGALSVTGNVTGANLVTSGVLSVIGNANIGNIGTGIVTSTGNVTGANLITGGLVTATGNVNSANINTGNVFASGNAVSNNIIANTVAYVGPGATGTAFSAPTIIGVNSDAEYIQAALVNKTATGSADWIAYGDNGNDVAGWMDMGFTGSNFNDANYTITGKNDGYLFVKPVNGTGLGGNLVIATDGTGTDNDIVFATGGFLTANEKMRFIDAQNQFYIKTTTVSTSTSTGALRVAGGVGIAGNTFVGGTLSASGTLTSGNLATTGTLSAGGDANVGNLGTSGLVTATGNITGANLITGGLVTASEIGRAHV